MCFNLHLARICDELLPIGGSADVGALDMGTLRVARVGVYCAGGDASRRSVDF